MESGAGDDSLAGIRNFWARSPNSLAPPLLVPPSRIKRPIGFGLFGEGARGRFLSAQSEPTLRKRVDVPEGLQGVEAWRGAGPAGTVRPGPQRGGVSRAVLSPALPVGARAPCWLNSPHRTSKARWGSPPRWCSMSEGFVSMEAGGISGAQGAMPPVNELRRVGAGWR